MKRLLNSVQRRSGARLCLIRSNRIVPLLFVGWVLLPLAASFAAEGSTPQLELNDNEIAQAVNSDLWVDEGVSTPLVDVTAVDGVVTLTGSVDNLLAKERAVKIAKSIRGVRAVVDELDVKPVVRTDREIRTDILLALARDPATDSYKVAVSVKDGEATLKGRVDSWQEQQLAAQVAKGVRGVKQVKNEIQWEWTAGRSDSEIRADIEERLASDIWVDDGWINVKVKDGQVRLDGSVGSAIEQSYATIDSWVVGVKSVDDSGLQVVPILKDPNRRPSRSAYRSDKEIVRAAKRALALDPRIRADQVSVTATAGMVTLAGRVGSLQAKQAAEQDVGNTLGVSSVDNWLKVRPTVAPTDGQIANEIRDALMASPYLEREEGIRIKVVNQEAYLTGRVESRFEKQTAGALAAGVSGVVAVHNDLGLTDLPYTYFVYPLSLYPTWDYYSDSHPRPYRLGQHAATSDAQIKTRVEDQLLWSPFVDRDDIAVTVTNGVVTLLGTVHSRMERGAAVDNAYQGGAVSVVDDLTLPRGSGS